MADNIQTSLRLPADLYEWLRRTAFERKMSQSELVRVLLEAERSRDSSA